MSDNQTHAVGEVPPLANGSDVIHRLMYLWAKRRPAGKINAFEIYSITTTGSDLSAIAEAGDRIIDLEKQLATRDKQIATLSEDAGKWREREERKANMLAAGLLRRPLRAPRIGDDE